MFFIVDDPFGIIYNENCLAERSDDVIKLKEFEAKTEPVYTSFIFGNSRASSFRKSDLELYFRDSLIFYFNSPGESALNIYKKIKIISKRTKIKNAIILLDEGILQNTNNEHPFYKGLVYNHSPKTSNISYFEFYTNYLQYYFQDYFFAKHIYYLITKRYLKEWMGNAFKDPAVNKRNNNPLIHSTKADSLIETNFTAYKLIYKPDYSDNSKAISKIDKRDIVILSKIKNEFDMQNTNYKVIIAPAFHKKRIAERIHNSLDSIFGDSFTDLSGLNKITIDSTLNYENLHYTGKAARMILDSVYSNK